MNAEGGAVRLHYYAETDSLYIELKSGPGTGARKVPEGVNADTDTAGDVVGFDIDPASQRPSLAMLQQGREAARAAFVKLLQEAEAESERDGRHCLDDLLSDMDTIIAAAERKAR